MVFRVVTRIITVIIGAVRALCENAPLMRAPHVPLHAVPALPPGVLARSHFAMGIVHQSQEDYVLLPGSKVDMVTDFLGVFAFCAAMGFHFYYRRVVITYSAGVRPPACSPSEPEESEPDSPDSLRVRIPRLCVGSATPGSTQHEMLLPQFLESCDLPVPCCGCPSRSSFLCDLGLGMEVWGR